MLFSLELRDASLPCRQPVFVSVHQNIQLTCRLVLAFHLPPSPPYPPIPPLISPLPLLAPLTFCLPHIHTPPYRKKGWVSKRHSQDFPDVFLRRNDSQGMFTPEQQGCLFRVQSFPQITSCAATFSGISRGFSLSSTAVHLCPLCLIM